MEYISTVLDPYKQGNKDTIEKMKKFNEEQLDVMGEIQKYIQRRCNYRTSGMERPRWTDDGGTTIHDVQDSEKSSFHKPAAYFKKSQLV